MTNCGPNKAAIDAHFQDSVGWSSIPIFGPIIGNYASRPIPPDASEDLDTANADFNNATDVFSKAVANSIYSTAIDLDNLTSLLKPFVDTEVEMYTLADHQLLYLMGVQVVALTVIVYLIFFRVIR